MFTALIIFAAAAAVTFVFIMLWRDTGVDRPDLMAEYNDTYQTAYGRKTMTVPSSPSWSQNSATVIPIATPNSDQFQGLDADELRRYKAQWLQMAQRQGRTQEVEKMFDDLITQADFRAERKAAMKAAEEEAQKDDPCPECGALFSLQDDYICPDCRAKVG